VIERKAVFSPRLEDLLTVTQALAPRKIPDTEGNKTADLSGRGGGRGEHGFGARGLITERGRSARLVVRVVGICRVNKAG